MEKLIDKTGQAPTTADNVNGPGTRLRDERKRLRLNQTELASVAGATKQTLFSWEAGKTAPDALQLAALAAAGVDVMYVITGYPITDLRRAMQVNADLRPDQLELLALFDQMGEAERHALIVLMRGMGHQSTDQVRP